MTREEFQPFIRELVAARDDGVFDDDKAALRLISRAFNHGGVSELPGNGELEELVLLRKRTLERSIRALSEDY